MHIKAPRLETGLSEADPQPARQTRVVFEDGHLVLARRAPAGDAHGAPRPLPAAGLDALLLRREDLLGARGPDPLFHPAGWGELDMALCAWRQGQRLLEVPGAVVERHGRAGHRELPAPLVERARGVDRWLLTWKHLDTRAAAQAHLEDLWREALDAGLAGEREALLRMALALEGIEAASASRGTLAEAPRGLQAALDAAGR